MLLLPTESLIPWKTSKSSQDFDRIFSPPVTVTFSQLVGEAAQLLPPGACSLSENTGIYISNRRIEQAAGGMMFVMGSVRKTREMAPVSPLAHRPLLEKVGGEMFVCPALRTRLVLMSPPWLSGHLEAGSPLQFAVAWDWAFSVIGDVTIASLSILLCHRKDCPPNTLSLLTPWGNNG